MSKICKSCGNYYDGDYCTKCGYGKPDVRSKSLEKLKKQAMRKPERFMTDEEKKELYSQRAAKQKANTERTADPNARRNMLIIVAIVAVCVVFGVLISNGLLFKTEKTDVIKQYFSALSSRNYDDFVKCFPKEIKNLYEDDRKTLGLDKSAYMDEFLKDFETEYGSGFSAAVSCGKEQQLTGSEIDLSDYKAQYGSAPSVSEAYIVTCEVTFSGSKKSETLQYECYVGKVSGRWKLFNVQYNAGTITPDMEIQDPEQYQNGTDDSVE